MSTNVKPGDICLLLLGIPEAGCVAAALRVASTEELRKALGLPGEIPFNYRGTCWHIDRDTTWEVRTHGELTGLVKVPYVGEKYLWPLCGGEPVTQERETEVPA